MRLPIRFCPCLVGPWRKELAQFLGGAQGTLSLCLELPEPRLTQPVTEGHLLGCGLLPERLPLFVGKDYLNC